MKGALIIGIDNYPGKKRLHGCVNDASCVASLLKTNGDKTDNFEVDLQTEVQTRPVLRAMIAKLFKADLDTALLYFAGHGCNNERGGFVVTPDSEEFDEGILMDEILSLANRSQIQNKIIILDCCHAGALGNPSLTGGNFSFLSDGVTILASARPVDASVEIDGQGVFTSLLCDALEGGAADISGKITMGSIYAYIDRSLSFMEQRPQFKTNVSRFFPVRTIPPAVPVSDVLKKLTTYFQTPESHFALDPSYEYTNVGIALPEHVAIFKNLQKMQSVGLVVPVEEEFMYWAAQKNKACKLTHLGKHYWRLVKANRLSG